MLHPCDKTKLGIKCQLVEDNAIQGFVLTTANTVNNKKTQLIKSDAAFNDIMTTRGNK